MSELDELIKGDTDLYGILGVETSADERQIQRGYRQQALIYHPDKNPSIEAHDRFQLISQTLKILTDSVLRAKYDSLRKIRLERERLDKQLDEKQLRLKKELYQAEREHMDSLKQRGMNRLDFLQEEGMRRRVAKEEQLRQKVSTTSKPQYMYTGFPSPGINEMSVDDSDDLVRTVKVKWKHKPEIADLFTSDVLSSIMSIFGEVSYCHINPASGNVTKKYDTGVLVFKELKAADSATNHDYSKSASLWDGTSNRKLSSLLREVKFVKPRTSSGLDEDANNLFRQMEHDPWYDACGLKFTPFFNELKFTRNYRYHGQDLFKNVLNDLRSEEIKRYKKRKIESRA